MAQTDERYAEAQRLSRLLVVIAERAKCDFATGAGALGLPVHLARAVLMLTEPAPMRMLAEQLSCDRSYITNLADQLEERGLVERVPGDDRRVKLLALTPHGVSVRDALSDAVGRQSMVLRRLNDAQRASLTQLLEALAEEPG
jgi:DNA-binding MarR family transcriptional regulator